MAEEILIECDGRRFHRMSGTWVDSSCLVVPAALGAKLNALAKLDPAVWQLIQGKDVEEGRTGKRKGVTPGGGGTARRLARPSVLSWTFDDCGTLTISAALAARWRHRRNTWGFVDTTLLSGLHDQDIRVQVAVLSQGRQYTPDVPDAHGASRGVEFTTEHGRITLGIRLFDQQRLSNDELGWTETKNGKPLVFRNEPIRPGDHIDIGVVSFWMTLWLVAQPPQRKPAPTYFDWARRFFPGGLPSLGKGHS
jgi:hypothetical protein